MRKFMNEINEEKMERELREQCKFLIKTYERVFPLKMELHPVFLVEPSHVEGCELALEMIKGRKADAQNVYELESLLRLSSKPENCTSDEHLESFTLDSPEQG